VSSFKARSRGGRSTTEGRENHSPVNVSTTTAVPNLSGFEMLYGIVGLNVLFSGPRSDAQVTASSTSGPLQRPNRSNFRWVGARPLTRETKESTNIRSALTHRRIEVPDDETHIRSILRCHFYGYALQIISHHHAALQIIHTAPYSTQVSVRTNNDGACISAVQCNAGPVSTEWVTNKIEKIVKSSSRRAVSSGM